MKKTLPLLSFISCTLLLGPNALAKTQIGVVISSRGAVTASSGTLSRPLNRRSSIYVSDKIHTGTNSTVKIRFTDSSIVSLTPKTTYQVNTYQYNSKPINPSGQFRAKLTVGGFRTATGNIPKQNYQVNTPVAILGVRGTVFGAYQSPQTGLLIGLYTGKLHMQVAGRSAPINIAASSNAQFFGINTKGQVIALPTQPAQLQKSTLTPADIQTVDKATNIAKLKSAVKRAIDNVLKQKESSRQAFRDVKKLAPFVTKDQFDAAVIINAKNQGNASLANRLTAKLSPSGKAQLASAETGTTSSTANSTDNLSGADGTAASFVNEANAVSS